MIILVSILMMRYIGLEMPWYTYCPKLGKISPQDDDDIITYGLQERIRGVLLKVYYTFDIIQQKHV